MPNILIAADSRISASANIEHEFCILALLYSNRGWTLLLFFLLCLPRTFFSTFAAVSPARPYPWLFIRCLAEKVHAGISSICLDLSVDAQESVLESGPHFWRLDVWKSDPPWTKVLRDLQTEQTVTIFPLKTAGLNSKSRNSKMQRNYCDILYTSLPAVTQCQKFPRQQFG